MTRYAKAATIHRRRWVGRRLFHPRRTTQTAVGSRENPRLPPGSTGAAGVLFSPDLLDDLIEETMPRPGERTELFRALERFELDEHRRPASERSTAPEEPRREGVFARLRAAWHRRFR